MFNNLIDSLSKAHQLSADKEKLLRNLNLTSYQDIADMLRLDGDKQTILALTAAIGSSIFVEHSLDWTNVKPAIVHLLESYDPEIRGKAARALGFLDATETLDTLAKIATSDEDDSIRMVAINAIGHWHLSGSAPYLVPIALDRKQPSLVRETAIEALGDSSSIEVITILIELLHDEDVGIRDVAILALHNAQGLLAIPQLETLLTDQTLTRFGETIAEHAQRTITYLVGRGTQLTEEE